MLLILITSWFVFLFGFFLGMLFMMTKSHSHYSILKPGLCSANCLKWSDILKSQDKGRVGQGCSNLTQAV